jgi:hypothetical protein
MNKHIRGIKYIAKNAWYFCKFRVTAKSKHSTIGQKFAQSGHPEADLQTQVEKGAKSTRPRKLPAQKKLL